MQRPEHYAQVPGIECTIVAEQFSYSLGCAVKYIWRCNHKGNKIQDLKKAMAYIQFEIDKTEREVSHKTEQR